MIYVLITSNKNASTPHRLHSTLSQNKILLCSVCINHLTAYHQGPVKITTKRVSCVAHPLKICFAPPHPHKNKQIALFSPHEPSRKLPPRSYTNNNKISENCFLIPSWSALALILPSWQICFKPHHHHRSTYDNHNFFLTRPTSEVHLADPLAISPITAKILYRLPKNERKKFLTFS